MGSSELYVHTVYVTNCSVKLTSIITRVINYSKRIMTVKTLVTLTTAMTLAK